MTGNQIFWQSGTWGLFAGQIAVLILILVLYFYMGKKEKEAKDRQTSKGSRVQYFEGDY